MELSKSRISILASLSSKKMRKKHGIFLAEGEKCAFDTMGAFVLEALLVTKEWFEKNQVIARNLPHLYVEDRKVIEKISSLSTPPDVIAVYRIPEMTVPTIEQDKLYLMLDDIQDPGNLGTIIRTADWFGVRTIIASNSTVDVFNPKTVQASMGSLSRVKVYYTDLKAIIKMHPELPLYGMLLNGKSIFKERLSANGFILMGNEGNGISEELRNLVTDALLIPPSDPADHPESLNVAIASAVTLSQFRSRQNISITN